MRLIDDFVYRKSILKECEKLKKELEEAIENEDHEVVLAIRNQLSAFKLAIKLIDIQPTAYNIDKVVEELQESASRYTKKYTTPYGDKGYKDVKAISVNKAVEIVKAGMKNG